MELKNTTNRPLSLSQGKEMDTLAVEGFDLPIELMIESAGLQLARRVSAYILPNKEIVIGTENGNNGGGGLVAARRLAGWGHTVILDLSVEFTKDLPQKQLKRELSVGVKHKKTANPAIWIDAYLGFSLRLPLATSYQDSIEQANRSNAYRISLDLQTGISSNLDCNMSDGRGILTLAAYKQILKSQPESTAIYLAYIGFPLSVYTKFSLQQPDFYKLKPY